MLIDCEVARELQWFPLCNTDVQFNCWALKSVWASLFLKISLLKFPGWASIASSWLIWISKETRRTIPGLSLSLECRRCPYCQPQILITDNCMGKYFSRILVYRSCGVVFQLVLKIILQMFEYQISSSPPKNITNPYSWRYYRWFILCDTRCGDDGPQSCCPVSVAANIMKQALKAFIC